MGAGCAMPCTVSTSIIPLFTRERSSLIPDSPENRPSKGAGQTVQICRNCGESYVFANRRSGRSRLGRLTSHKQGMVNFALRGTQGAECQCDLLGQPLRSSFAIDERHRHSGFEQKITAPHDPLIKLDARAARFDEPRLGLEEIIDPAGLEELARHAPHYKTGTGFGLMPVRALVNAQEPEAIRTRPLAEFEIIGMIDGTREIGVLVVDADGQAMHAALD